MCDLTMAHPVYSLLKAGVYRIVLINVNLKQTNLRKCKTINLNTNKLNILFHLQPILQMQYSRAQIFILALNARVSALVLHRHQGFFKDSCP